MQQIMHRHMYLSRYINRVSQSVSLSPHDYGHYVATALICSKLGYIVQTFMPSTFAITHYNHSTIETCRNQHQILSPF